MKKFLALWVPPIVALLIVLSKVPYIDKLLTEYDPNSHLLVGVFIASATFASQYFTAISPYKKYEKLERHKWALLDYMVQSLVKTYEEEHDVEVSLNIMVPKTKWFIWLEPKSKGSKQKKFQLKVKVFKIIWTSKVGVVNKKLKLTVNQGICGQAYKEGQGNSRSLINTHSRDYNLNDEQISMTKHLHMVSCMPIFAIDDTYTGQKTSKVLGVLNLESDSDGSEQLVTTNSKRKPLHDRLASLSDVCSKLL